MAIPVSALRGDNILQPSDAMTWYEGPTLLEHLETVKVDPEAREPAFRLPVQWVCRPNQAFRGFAGTLISGPLSVGDEVVVLPSGRRSRVARIIVGIRDVAHAGEGQAIIATLVDEVDASRGDVIAAAGLQPEVADQFAAHLLWLGEGQMLP